MAPSLSVTIVNHNQWPLLRECLQSLRQYPLSAGTTDVLVVDNCSEDGAVDHIPEHFPEVRVLRRRIRRGFGANQNFAISHTESDLVLALNPDTLVFPGTLDELVSAVRETGAAISAGPQLRPDGDSPPGSLFPYPTPGRAWIEAFLVKDRRAPSRLQRTVVDDAWVSGHAFVIDRSWFDRVNGFDESFFMYSEEVDLMRRITLAGGTIAWCPGAPTAHVGKTSEGSRLNETVLPMRTWRQMARGEVRYIRKHHGRVGSLLFRLGSALDALIRIIALKTPWLRSRMAPKGPTPSSTAAYHRIRALAYLGIGADDDLEASAAEWNRLNADDHTSRDDVS